MERGLVKGSMWKGLAHVLTILKHCTIPTYICILYIFGRWLDDYGLLLIFNANEGKVEKITKLTTIWLSNKIYRIRVKWTNAQYTTLMHQTIYIQIETATMTMMRINLCLIGWIFWSVFAVHRCIYFRQKTVKRN